MTAELGMRSDVLKENLVEALMSFYGDAADDGRRVDAPVPVCLCHVQRHHRTVCQLIEQSVGIAVAQTADGR